MFRLYPASNAVRHCNYFFSVALAIILTCVAAVPDAAAQAQSELEEYNCRLPPSAAVVASRFRCGHVAVPRIYGDAASGSYRLHVVLIAAEDLAASRADAVLLLAGGPGESIMDIVVTATAVATIPFNIDRDLVLIDVRGAGTSEPQICRENKEESWRNLLAANFTRQDVVETSRGMMRECFREALNAGHEPSAFGSHIDAVDIETVRLALDKDPWNVIGTSYGAVTALTLAHTFPDSVRSLVLDSPALGQLHPVNIAEGWNSAKAALLAACAADLRCLRKYPDLSSEMDAALRQVESEPLILDTSHGSSVYNRSELEMQLFGVMYQYETARRVPELVRTLVEGRTDKLIAWQEEAVGRLQGLSLFTLAATICRDNDPSSRMRMGQSPGAAHAFELVLPGSSCDLWGIPRLAPPLDEPTRIDTLVLSGAHDPITPPPVGRMAAELLGTKARRIVIPNAGHAVLPYSGCAVQIALGFLQNPAAPLDVSCLPDEVVYDFE